MFSCNDGGKKAGHRGEYDISVKTIARGKPGVPVNLWSTTVCLLPFAHGAMGAAGTRFSLRPLSRGSPAPFDSRRANFANPGATSRGISDVCPRFIPARFPDRMLRFFPAGRTVFGSYRRSARLCRGDGCTEAVRCQPARTCYNFAMTRIPAFGSAQARIRCLIRRNRPVPH